MIKSHSIAVRFVAILLLSCSPRVGLSTAQAQVKVEEIAAQIQRTKEMVETALQGQTSGGNQSQNQVLKPSTLQSQQHPGSAVEPTVNTEKPPPPGRPVSETVSLQHQATRPPPAEVARPADAAPVSISKAIRDQSIEQRGAIAQSIDQDIKKLTDELNNLLATEEKTPAIWTAVTELNKALSAKQQAYDLALGKPGFVSNAAAESFLSTSNPYFLMCGDSLWTREDTLKWAQLISPVKNKLVSAGRSVGAIIVGGRHIGTGFTVGEGGVILTNAHVLRELADFDIKSKLWRVKPTATIVFDLEFPLGSEANCEMPNESKTYKINAIAFASPDASTAKKNEEIRDDIAVLIAATDDRFPRPLDITAPSAEKYIGQMVLAVIGYPGQPRDMTIREAMDNFSPPGRIDPVSPYKRLSGGFSGDRPPTVDGVFAHRANTAQGSSGSPIFNLADGNVIGVHMRGEDRNNVFAKNLGISGERLRTLLTKVGIFAK